MNMKKLLSVFAALCTLTACSLKEDASSITSPYYFYNNPEQVRAALNACYNPITNIYTYNYLICLEGQSDLASCNGSAQKDARLDIQPSTTGNSCGPTVWSNAYGGVRYCLSTRAGIDRSTQMTAEEKAPLRAETTILLSLYYYILTSHFGNVPFYEDYVETDEDIDRIAHMGRCPADATRAALIAELKEACPVLDQVRTCDIAGNYAGAAMGWMLMARMAAWNKDWDTVIEAVSHLEEIYGDLNQYSYADVQYRRKNTPESIFEVQHTYSAGGVIKTTTCASCCMPYPRTAGTNIYDGVAIEELGDQATTYASLRPSNYMKNTIQNISSTDIRRDYNMCYQYNGQRFNGNRTWMGPKFWCPGQYTTYDSGNFKMFRYAGALLLMAEAYIEKENFAEGIRYLDMVRSRANLAGYSGQKSLLKLREAVRAECARELFGEFIRKYDLVRWGIWYSAVLQNNDYNLLLENIKPCHEYYPIPLDQVMASGYTLDNAAYDKDGLGGN